MSALEWDCDRLEALIIRLLLLTGCRKSEILRARWENLDLERGILTVPLSKSGQPRHVILSAAALELLRGFASEPRNSAIPLLFPNKIGEKPLADIYRYWNKLRQSLKLEDVRLPDLRHSFASYVVNSGHNLYEAQNLLGHANPRTTMRYVHMDRKNLRVAVDNVAGILEEGKKAKIATHGQQGNGSGKWIGTNVERIAGEIKLDSCTVSATGFLLLFYGVIGFF